MKTHGLFSLAVVFGTVISSDPVPRANAATITPPMVGIPDTGVKHDLYGNGLDLPPATGVESQLGPGAGETWVVTIQNISTITWSDFELNFRNNTPFGAACMVFNKVTVTGGFGGSPGSPASFDISDSGQTAAIFSSAGVAPGGSITLSISTKNSSPFLLENYHIGAMATPEASSTFALLGLGALGVLVYDRRRRLAES